MAQDLDDGEFWLPSEFLTDDDFRADRLQAKNGLDDFSHNGNSFVFNSGESFMGSTETEESDEDDEFITRRLVHSDSNFASDYTAKCWNLSGSPQSTLCGFKPVSKSQCSPNGFSRAYSPPDGKEVGWDLLNAARMRMIQGSPPKQFLPPKPSPVNKPNPAVGFHPNHQALYTYSQFQASHTMNQQQIVHVRGQGKLDYPVHKGRTVDTLQSLSAMASWPTLHQSQQGSSGSRMRAAFLGGSGLKQKRTGTGVFLPPRIGTNPPQTRKKIECGNAAGMRRNRVLMPEHRNLMHPELKLPQDWTY